MADTIEEYKELVNDLESIAEELDENNYRERLWLLTNFLKYPKILGISYLTQLFLQSIILSP